MRRRPGRKPTVAALAACLALAAAACSGSDDGGDADESADPGTETAALPDAYQGYQSDTYANDASWLCKPGIANDVCARELDATVVNADGTTQVEPHDPAANPPVDCFYVYPTVSSDAGSNSDLTPAEAEEITAVVNQAARLNATCRVFAPIYRQGTLSSIGTGSTEGPGAADFWQTAYGDVLDAFRYYVANESEGRGFVLVGHSQGASHLNRLVAEEIDDQPALRDRMVSALLIGWPVTLPEGASAGGDFQNVPVCETTEQIGCVVSYSAFRSTEPPPAGSIFGRPMGGEGIAACVNPASPGGGAATLHPYFAVRQPPGALIGGGSAQPFADAARTAEITTPFVSYPDFIQGECVREGEFSYLKLTIQGDPADPRTDDISGDLTPEWGLHLADANVAMGDLVTMVSAQAATYTG